MGYDTVGGKYYFFNDIRIYATDSPPPKCHLFLKLHLIK